MKLEKPLTFNQSLFKIGIPLAVLSFTEMRLFSSVLLQDGDVFFCFEARLKVEVNL